MKINCDLSHLYMEIKTKEYQPALDAIHQKLHCGCVANTKWVTYPTDIAPEVVAAIETAAQRIRRTCTAFVVIGIGGSYLAVSYTHLVPYTPRAFAAHAYQPPEVDAEAVKEVLTTFRQYGSKTVSNCGACGHDTCYEKAVAVVRGEAEQEMCMSYMRQRAESMAHTIVRSVPSAIIVFDKDFIIKEANPAAYEMFRPYGLKKGNALFESIDIRYMERVVDTGMGLRDKVVHYADIDLWTRQIIVRMYDTKELYLAIIEDITEQEKKRQELEKIKSETLDKANQVINNQMMVAQQIAGLLGETTAETKITLLNLIKQFEREKELE